MPISSDVKTGSVLIIDLTREKVTRKELGVGTFRAYLGGRGLNSLAILRCSTAR